MFFSGILQILALSQAFTLLVLAVRKAVLRRSVDKDPRNKSGIDFILFSSILGYGWVLLSYFNLRRLNFFFSILLLVIAFSPYLFKASKYRENIAETRKSREITDKLIITSFVYLLASVYGIAKGQYEIAFLCACTWMSSSVYHYSRESMFFNLDNIFASSLAVVIIYSQWLSYGDAELLWYSNITHIGVILAVILLALCGLPAELVVDKSSCCIRKGRPFYDDVHSLWHIVSGFGPLLAIWSLDNALVNRKVEINLVTFILPITAVAIGVVLNIIGNLCEVIPVD